MSKIESEPHVLTASQAEAALEIGVEIEKLRQENKKLKDLVEEIWVNSMSSIILYKDVGDSYSNGRVANARETLSIIRHHEKVDNTTLV